MARSSKKARRLAADGEIFLWSLRHEHRAEQGRYLFGTAAANRNMNTPG